MQAIFKRLFSKAKVRLHQIVFEASSWVRSFKGIVNLEDESNESKKLFYLFSLVLLVSLFFMSPDKILQIFTSIQSENGMFEKIHEVTRMLRRLVPSLS